MDTYDFDGIRFWHHISSWHGSWGRHTAPTQYWMILIRYLDGALSMACSPSGIRVGGRSGRILSWPRSQGSSFWQECAFSVCQYPNVPDAGTDRAGCVPEAASLQRHSRQDSSIRRHGARYRRQSDARD